MAFGAGRAVGSGGVAGTGPCGPAVAGATHARAAARGGAPAPPTSRLRRRPRPSRAVPPGPGPHLPGLPPGGRLASLCRFSPVSRACAPSSGAGREGVVRLPAVFLSGGDCLLPGAGPDARGNASPGQGQAPGSVPQGHQPRTVGGTSPPLRASAGAHLRRAVRSRPALGRTCPGCRRGEGPAGQPLQIQPGFPGLGSQQQCWPRTCSSSTCGSSLWRWLPSAGGVA